MIKIEKQEVVGLEAAIRGMRNPMNSWEKSDSHFNYYKNGPLMEPKGFYLGENDHQLMMKLANGGPVHAKYRRMIAVYVDITAPLYWWKEFDTYKVGTVANSCSTMHKIHEKEFTLEDFSCEHLASNDAEGAHCLMSNMEFPDKDPYAWHLYPKNLLLLTITMLNSNRNMFLQTQDKKYWWQMIQLLPSSYNQKRTVMLNYEVLAGIYKWRKNHKLDEWVEFCKWIETLPYSELITTCKDTPNIKTGEWLCVDAVDNGPSKYKCSACGTEYMDRIEHINYCGHCGAKMAKEPTKEDSNV